MNNNTNEIVNNGSRMPQAIAAALLAAAMSFTLAAEATANAENKLLAWTAMLLCAAITFFLELPKLPRLANILIPATAAVVGAAAVFIPWEWGSVASRLLAEKSVPVGALVLPVLCACVLLCSAVRLVNSGFVLRCITAGSIALCLLVFVWARIKLDTLPMLLYIAYVLLVLCQIMTPAEKTDEGVRRTVWYFPLCVAVILAALIIPVPKTRIQWEKLVQVKGSQQLEELEDALDVDKVDDGTSQSGVDDDVSSLGGWLQVTSDKCLDVTFDGVYTTDRLTGGIYDSYTGRGWVSVTPPEGAGYTTSDTDMPYSQSPYGMVQIRNLYGAGSNIFYPPYTNNIQNINSRLDAYRDDSRMTFGEVFPEYYSVCFAGSVTQYSLADELRAACLALPEELPERVTQYAEETTAGCTTDYEKALALRDRLAALEYTTEVGEVPEGADFVEHFLYESGEGYCVYFASAMAVLARCEGIPSRFVIGYSVPKSSRKTVRINSGNAHAWAELYIEGHGWVVFDPVKTRAAAQAQAAMEEEIENELEQAKNAAMLKKVLIYIYSAVAAAVLLFLVSHPFVQRIVRRSRMRKLHAGKRGYAVIRRCHRAMWVLAAAGIKRSPEETLAEYGVRLESECKWLSRKNLSRLLSLFEDTEKALYSAQCPALRRSRGTVWTVRWSYIRCYGLLRWLQGWWKASL